MVKKMNPLEKCEQCPDFIFEDVQDYIRRLEAQNAELVRKTEQLQSIMGQVQKALQDNGFGSLKELLQAYSQVKAERDAAVTDIHKTCSTCKHYYYNRQDDDTADCLWFDGCKIEDHWEWRGVPEPPKQGAEKREAGHEWISVEDRLPEAKLAVLAYGRRHIRKTETTELPAPHVAYTRGEDEGWFTWDYGDYVYVSHWMPLPEPPEEE